MKADYSKKTALVSVFDWMVLTFGGRCLLFPFDSRKGMHYHFFNSMQHKHLQTYVRALQWAMPMNDDIKVFPLDSKEADKWFNLDHPKGEYCKYLKDNWTKTNYVICEWEIETFESDKDKLKYSNMFSVGGPFWDAPAVDDYEEFIPNHDYDSYIR